MKECFKCGVEKPLSDFYKHKMMADGHLNKCKECAKKDVKKNREDNSEYYKKYDAWRFRNDSRVKDRHKKYRGTISCIQSMSKSRSKWNENNPEARYAHGAVARAIRSGKLEKPDTCSCCGYFTPSRLLHGHHHDYSRPLDVTWLCTYCHKAVHAYE